MESWRGRSSTLLVRNQHELAYRPSAPCRRKRDSSSESCRFPGASGSSFGSRIRSAAPLELSNAPGALNLASQEAKAVFAGDLLTDSGSRKNRPRHDREFMIAAKRRGAGFLSAGDSRPAPGAPDAGTWDRIVQLGGPQGVPLPERPRSGPGSLPDEEEGEDPCTFPISRSPWSSCSAR